MSRNIAKSLDDLFRTARNLDEKPQQFFSSFRRFILEHHEPGPDRDKMVANMDMAFENASNLLEETNE